jgi:hypothetical protein
MSMNQVTAQADRLIPGRGRNVRRRNNRQQLLILRDMIARKTGEALSGGQLRRGRAWSAPLRARSRCRIEQPLTACRHVTYLLFQSTFGRNKEPMQDVCSDVYSSQETTAVQAAAMDLQPRRSVFRYLYARDWRQSGEI